VYRRLVIKIGVGCLMACVTAAVVRSQMAGYYRRR
jgi:hypothetical protein